MKRVAWPWVLVALVAGAVVAPKLRSLFPRLPSYGG